jgi:hypothetical protein
MVQWGDYKNVIFDLYGHEELRDKWKGSFVSDDPKPKKRRGKSTKRGDVDLVPPIPTSTSVAPIDAHVVQQTNYDDAEKQAERQKIAEARRIRRREFWAAVKRETATRSGAAICRTDQFLEKISGEENHLIHGFLRVMVVTVIVVIGLVILWPLLSRML